MDFNQNADLDDSLVLGTSSGGGGGRGGGMAVGGLGGIILLILSLVLGFNPNILGGLGGGDPQSQTQPDVAQKPQCRQAGAMEQYPECRYSAYMNSLSTYWNGALRGHRAATMQPFKGAVNTACGQATSEVGPFYCPGDEMIYLDSDFFGELESRFGAKSGYSTEAYVVAHEYGHHIQNLTGTMQRAQQDRSTGADSASVRLELQADCYAGVWLKHSTDDPQGPIQNVTQEDLNLAVDAAKAVGDDNIQERATGRVDRESWTHGSSAMRKYWLAQGYNSGDARVCDTFAADAKVG